MLRLILASCSFWRTFARAFPFSSLSARTLSVASVARIRPGYTAVHELGVGHGAGRGRDHLKIVGHGRKAVHACDASRGVTQADDAGAEACWLRLIGTTDAPHFASVAEGLRGYKARHQLALHYERRGRHAEQPPEQIVDRVGRRRRSAGGDHL